MNEWLDEEFEFEIEVTGFLRGEDTIGYCSNGEEIGDKYTSTYGCPVNEQGYGICAKTMMILYPIMEAVRSRGDLRNIGGADEYTKGDGTIQTSLKASMELSMVFFLVH